MMLLARSERPAGHSDFTVLVTALGCIIIARSPTARLQGCPLAGGVPLSFTIQDSVILDACVGWRAEAWTVVLHEQSLCQLIRRSLPGAHLLGLPRPGR